MLDPAGDEKRLTDWLVGQQRSLWLYALRILLIVSFFLCDVFSSIGSALFSICSLFCFPCKLVTPHKWKVSRRAKVAMLNFSVILTF